MPIYQELRTLADKAIKENWLTGDEEKRTRHKILIDLYDLIKNPTPSSSLALTDSTTTETEKHSVNRLLQKITNESQEPITAGVATQILDYLSSILIINRFSANKRLLEICEGDFTEVLARNASKPLIEIQGSSFAWAREDATESLLKKIAEEALGISHFAIVPITAASSNASASSTAVATVMDFLSRGPFDFKLPLGRKIRVKSLGFNTDHPLDQLLHQLVIQSKARTSEETPDSSSIQEEIIEEMKTALTDYFESESRDFPSIESFNQKNVTALSKTDSERLLREIKNLALNQAKKPDELKARNLLEAMIIAGYALAWDTALQDLTPKEARPRYTLLAAVATDSARTDEYSTSQAVALILRSEQTTADGIKTAFKQLLKSPDGGAAAVDPSLQYTIASLAALASGAIKKPGEKLESTTYQCPALEVLALLALLCACREFNASAKTQTAFFEAMIAAARTYYLIFILQNQCNGQTLGSAEDPLTPAMQSAIMKECLLNVKDLGTTNKDCEGAILAKLASNLINFSSNQAFSIGLFGSNLQLQPTDKNQAIAFGKYLFEQATALLTPKQRSALATAGKFAQSPDESSISFKEHQENWSTLMGTAYSASPARAFRTALE